MIILDMGKLKMNRSIIEYFNENTNVWNNTKKYVGNFIKNKTEPVIKSESKLNSGEISKNKNFSDAINDYLKGPLGTINATKEKYNI